MTWGFSLSSSLQKPSIFDRLQGCRSLSVQVLPTRRRARRGGEGVWVGADRAGGVLLPVCRGAAPTHHLHPTYLLKHLHTDADPISGGLGLGAERVTCAQLASTPASAFSRAETGSHVAAAREIRGHAPASHSSRPWGPPDISCLENARALQVSSGSVQMARAFTSLPVCSPS